MIREDGALIDVDYEKDHHEVSRHIANLIWEELPKNVAITYDVLVGAVRRAMEK